MRQAEGSHHCKPTKGRRHGIGTQQQQQQQQGSCSVSMLTPTMPLPPTLPALRPWSCDVAAAAMGEMTAVRVAAGTAASAVPGADAAGVGAGGCAPMNCTARFDPRAVRMRRVTARSAPRDARCTRRSRVAGPCSASVAAARVAAWVVAGGRREARGWGRTREGGQAMGVERPA